MDAQKLGMLTDALTRGRISRRDFLKTAAGLGLSLPAAMGLLQACAPTPGAEPTAAPPPTAAPTTAPTVAPTAAPTAVPARTDLVVGQAKAALSFNPFAFGSYLDHPIMSSICDGLFEFDFKTSTLIPVLVEEWEQTDAVTWNLKLKEGVQFHKGYGEMTAEDWAFWANTAIAEQGQPYFAFGGGLVKEAVVTDKYGLEIRLTEPWAAFWVTTLIDYAAYVFSKKAFEEMGPEEFAMNPIGSGPFELDSWVPGGDLVLKKFEDYHDVDNIHLEKIIFTPVEDTVVRLEKLRAGEIDYTVGLSNKDMPEIDADPNLKVIWGVAHAYDAISFNFDQTDKPWADVRVRQAIAFAVDREQIVDVVYYGGAVLDDDVLPHGALGADPDPEFYPNTPDLDKAKALLAEAGYPDGFTMPCLTDDRENQRQEIVLLADQLAKVGITLEIEVVDLATQVTRRLNREFDVTLRTGGMTSPDSDSATRGMFACDQEVDNNGYCNPDLDDIMSRAGSSMDRDERDELYREACKILAEDAAMVWLCWVGRPYALNEKLQGFTPGPMFLFPHFKTFYWEA